MPPDPSKRATIAVSEQSRLLLRAMATRLGLDMRDCLDTVLLGAAMISGMDLAEVWEAGASKRGRIKR